ncbi:MAG: hypothetical protein P8P48_02090 [Saprospiraceae bacterium]|nr:hypothetical protein [Saprospiraceae bacterium]
MKQFIYILPAFLLLALTACNKDSSDNNAADSDNIPMDSLLLGTWEATQIELEYNSVNNIADSTLLVDMLADTSFKAAHQVTYNNNDTYDLLFEGSDETLMGIWNINGDTTLIRMEDNAIYEYSITAEKKNIISLQAIEDLDGDLEIDDIYRARYKKVQ